MRKKLMYRLIKCFVGLINAYKQVIDSGVDVAIVATPPVVRPAISNTPEKGKHSFLEKPICVDPVGYHHYGWPLAKQAAVKNLCVVTGTQTPSPTQLCRVLQEDHGRIDR